MNGVGTRALDDVQDGLGVQVALSGRLTPEGVGLVGEADVHRFPVQFAVDRHSGNAHLATRTNNADSNLSTVGNQDLLKHQFSSPALT